MAGKRPSASKGSRSRRWSLQDAKTHLSRIVREAHRIGPQRVTLHGKDLLVTPSTNTLLLNEGQRPPHHIVETLQIPIGVPAATVSYPMKAAFYSDYMGPLPYVFGAPPAETYTVRRLGR